jgi:hypothetical protein
VVTIAGLAGMKRRRYCVERAWQMSMQAPHSVLTPEVMSVCAGDAEADVVKVQNGEPSSGILDRRAHRVMFVCDRHRVPGRIVNLLTPEAMLQSCDEMRGRWK